MLTPTKLEAIKTAAKVLASATADNAPKNLIERFTQKYLATKAEAKAAFDPKSPTDVKILALSGFTAADLD